MLLSSLYVQKSVLFFSKNYGAIQIKSTLGNNFYDGTWSSIFLLEIFLPYIISITSIKNLFYYAFDSKWVFLCVCTWQHITLMSMSPCSVHTIHTATMKNTCFLRSNTYILKGQDLPGESWNEAWLTKPHHSSPCMDMVKISFTWTFWFLSSSIIWVLG